MDAVSFTVKFTDQKGEPSHFYTTQFQIALKFLSETSPSLVTSVLAHTSDGTTIMLY